jgi:DNA-binding CsgD family transcriptional regulator
MYQDKLENLWLGLDNGVDALEVSSPITYLDHFYGIETSYASIVFNGILYIGTNQGLFAKPVSEIATGILDHEEFQMVEGVVGQVWSLGEFNGKLICGNNLGTFVVDGFSSHQVSTRMGGWNYVEVPGTDDQLIGGTYTGLELYRYSSGSPNGWKKVDDIKLFEESCKELLFDEENYLWITHAYKGIFRLKLSNDLLSVDSVIIYNEAGGLPGLPYSVSRINGELRVVTGSGLYAYDSRLDSFLLDIKYDLLLNNEPGLAKVKEDYRGDLWYFTSSHMGVLRKQEDGSYLKITKPFKRIQNKFLGSNNENVFVYDRNSVFIGGERGIFHYNQNKPKQYDTEFRTFIGKVELKGNRQDSVLYRSGVSNSSIEIPYRLNSITAHFFSPYFEAPGYLSYSYKLEGFDQKWSPWESRNIKEYTNLREGEYVFLVKANNIYNNISEVAHLKFTITPPVYRTTAAYVLYAVILLLVAALFIVIVERRIRRARVREQERHRNELLEKEETYLEGVKLSNREIGRLKNEQLVIEMRHKNMELANSTMYLVRKNKLLTQVKSEIFDLIENLPIESNKNALRKIVHRIDRDIKSKQHWKVFDKYFDEVHEDFLTRLKERHPDLTPKDLRLCAYLRMNISTKEIAPLMNISVRGVEISRYRLRKRLKINQDVNLIEYILSI